ncbi:MAG: ATP-dependent RecD-like DNA helicase [Planctomycetota bacterium]|jgi:exodeoxyribonuclease V alpha subunit|nr:ATP-dependent RecD-like DNA helicase [Planctomycetota bacterium]
MTTPSPNPSAVPSDTVSGMVERVVFHNAESGFTVLRLKAKGVGELVTVVGAMPSVNSGEWLEASGTWVLDREYGEQLKAEWVRTICPDTLEGIERYLGSGLIKGIGPHFAAKLVAKFGKNVFEIIENTPERLTQIPGLGKKRRQLIISAWSEQKSIRDIMVFLHSHGVGSSRAYRIYKTYGDQAIAMVTENPYRLAHDIWGIGFQTADQVAASIGIPRDSDLRARAGIEYVLARLSENGHCAYPRDGLVAEAVKILAIATPVIEAAIDHGVAQGTLVVRSAPEGELVYLAVMDAAEAELAAALVGLSLGRHPAPTLDVPKALAWVEEKTGKKLSASQRQAVIDALHSKVMVITGGPGTGKTTIVNAIVKILAAKKLSIALSAPTGRAAKRLAETSGREAKTIHRLLEFDPASGNFKRKQENPLKGDVFVVDEASMLDTILACQLVRAIPRSAALILVGDVDQLPSVGPGMVLADIIQSGLFPVVRLTEIFRQATQSRIITNAHRVNHGELPEYPREKLANPASCDFYCLEAEDPDAIERKIVQLMSERLQAGFQLDPRREVQVLTPMQRGSLGAKNLNAVLQATLNPSAPGIQRFGLTFRQGDKVMQTVNDYEKDVFNGDIGLIASLDNEERQAVIDFDNHLVTYRYEEFDELSLSYAISIHKSQGSEYPCVVIPFHTQHYTMLQRNLLYTGITRGKRLVVLVASPKALAMAVRRVSSRSRVTSLQSRLAEAVKAAAARRRS